jgi:hypothetical protein
VVQAAERERLVERLAAPDGRRLRLTAAGRARAAAALGANGAGAAAA